MRRRVQISFLSVFLTLLTVAFAAALMVRVRSYSTIRPGVGTETPAAASDGSSDPAVMPRGGAIDGTIAPSPGPPTSSAPSPAAPTSPMTRAERFRQLLSLGVSKPAPAAPAPAAAQTQAHAPQPPPAAKPPQSAIARLIQPIVNAFRPTPSAAQAPAGGSSRTDTSRDVRDPNSDTTPPQLLSVSFDPPQVQDGGDTTLLITATDDLSGIRGVSGTLTSPNGKAVQGFAQQREGETMRYVSRIHIPEKAEEGIWKISFLTMSDLATNTVTLSAAQGTLPQSASLKVVSSASDSTPPSLRNVWLERDRMRAGEHNTLFVDAQDEKSGVHLVAAVFLSPSKLARFGVGCHKGANDAWECDVFPSECLDCGDWTLDQVQLQDNANNFATIKQENPAVKAIRLNIMGESCDNTPPVLQSLVLSRTELVMGRDDATVDVTVQVSDDACGVGGVSGQLVGPGGSSTGTFFSLQQRDGSTYVGTVRLHPQSARGVWRIGSITVNDKGQNIRTYYASDPLLARAAFNVR